LRAEYETYGDVQEERITIGKTGEYGGKAQQEAAHTHHMAMRRKSNIINGWALQIYQTSIFHIAAACFCVAANVILKGFLGGDGKWDEIFRVDLSLSIVWLVLLLSTCFTGRSYNNATSKPLPVSTRDVPARATMTAS